QAELFVWVRIRPQYGYFETARLGHPERRLNADEQTSAPHRQRAAPPASRAWPSTIPMPSVLDREVHDREADAFGHRHFASALADLIESPSNTPPFSIGLLGGWGMGKSTIKELYLADLQGSEVHSRDQGKRRERFHVITFNAWRYGGENVKRALL